MTPHSTLTERQNLEETSGIRQQKPSHIIFKNSDKEVKWVYESEWPDDLAQKKTGHLVLCVQEISFTKNFSSKCCHKAKKMKSPSIIIAS